MSRGADAVYAVNLNPGQTLAATLSTSNWDASVYLVADCANSATTCVAGSDSGNPESFTFTHNGATATTYYLVVDSWQTSNTTTTREGQYTLEIAFQ